MRIKKQEYLLLRQQLHVRHRQYRRWQQIDDGIPSQGLPLGQERLEPVNRAFGA